jgi:glycosyltransferase involved in cell wall biosynthesis
VDGERFHPAPGSSDAPALDGRPALLHVASLVPVKDQALLLEAFAGVRARAREARLHVVGDGPLRGALEARVARLGLTGVVRFHGSLPHDALPRIYRQAHVLVQSSRFESQGLVTLEAAASGCPALGTAVGVLPELFPAWTAAPGDATALKALLERALAKRPAPPSAEQLSPYGLPACVAGALALYRELSATERG